MTSLPSKYGRINKNNLSQEFYLFSLIEEGMKSGFISSSEADHIKLSILSLLKEQLKKYTIGDSTSVKAETAEDILQSITYTIGICLKEDDGPEAALKILKDNDIAEIYKRGKKIIKRKVKLAKQLHLMVLNTMVETDNITYNSTLRDGISGFFKLYDAEHSAHRINITADYPIFNSFPPLAGIEFIIKYLDCIYLENRFLKLFHRDSINMLLKSLGNNSKELVVNIYELVLVNSLGCIIAGSDIKKLTLSALDMVNLEAALSSKNDEEIKAALYAACTRLKKQLGIASTTLSSYIDKSMMQICADVTYAIRNECINTVFTEENTNPSLISIHSESNQNMDDDDYKNTIEEINECRYISDKISIIKEKIHSLYDFNALLHDAFLSADDLDQILATLSFEDLAVIYKKNAADSAYMDEPSRDTLIVSRIKYLTDKLNSKAKAKFFKLAETIQIDDISPL